MPFVSFWVCLSVRVHFVPPAAFSSGYSAPVLHSPRPLPSFSAMPCTLGADALYLVAEFSGVQTGTQLMTCAKETRPLPMTVLSLTRKWSVQLR